MTWKKNPPPEPISVLELIHDSLQGRGPGQREIVIDSWNVIFQHCSERMREILVGCGYFWLACDDAECPHNNDGRCRVEAEAARSAGIWDNTLGIGCAEGVVAKCRK